MSNNRKPYDPNKPYSGYIIIDKDGNPLRFNSDNALVVYGSMEDAQADFDPQFDDRIEPYNLPTGDKC